MEQVGVIGLGVMGCAMAANLRDAGWPVAGFDLSAERRKSLSQELTMAGSLDELAAQADILTMSLPGPAQCLDTIDHLARACRAGTLVIDLSTVDPESSKREAAAARVAGLGFVAAPVMGGEPAAQAGMLTIVAGADPADIARAMPLLEVVGDTIHSVPSAEEAAALKLFNNMVSLGNTVIFAEAFALAAKAGISLDAVYRVLNDGSAGSTALRRRYEVNIVPGDYDPGFSVDLAVKDLKLVRDFSQSEGLALEAAERTLRAFESLQADGLGQRDVAVLVPRLIGEHARDGDDSGAARPARDG